MVDMMRFKDEWGKDAKYICVATGAGQYVALE
jgi:hypothetical protein